MHMQSDQHYQKITIALAGIFQASALVHDLATTGSCDEETFNTVIQSLFKIDAPNVPAVYNGMEHLKRGFDELLNIFQKNRKAKPAPQISQYALGLILLQKQLVKDSDRLAEIRRRIKHVITQLDYFHELNSTIISNLADIYLNTISNLRFRLQIIGKGTYLHNEEIVSKIRALLLAGIRATILWQQVGGTRWQLFFSRGKLFEMAKKLRAEQS